MDEAAARLRLEMNSVPEEIDSLDRKVRQLEIERLNQVSHHEGGRIAHFVVGVAQAILRRFVVAFGKLYDFITRLSESGRYER